MSKNMTQTQSMKWLKSGLRGIAVFLLLGCTASILSACAFKPLYGNSAANSHLQQVLSSIEVVEIPGRVGQKVRNELIFHFTGGNHPEAPQYRLIIAVRESVTSQLVTRVGDSRGQIYKLNTKFKLFSQADAKTPLLKGVSNAQATFLDNPSVYSNVRSRLDAENRAAKTIAEDLQIRLAAFLSSNS